MQGRKKMNCKLFQLIKSSLQISFFVLIVSSTVSTTTFGQINHDLKVTLHPANHRLEIVDVITLPPASTSTEPFNFVLHKGLKPDFLD